MLTWNTSLAALILLAPGSRQDSDRLVDGMIERSNGLKSFVAKYRVHGRSKDAERREIEGDLRIVYRAPAELLVEFAHGEDKTRTVIANGKMSVEVRKAGQCVQRGETEAGLSLSEAIARIARNFHEQFPTLGDVAGSAGFEIFLGFRFKPGTDSERPEFHLEGGTGRGERALLAWLDRLKRSKAVPASEGDLLVWEAAEGIRVFMRKDTGFIEKVIWTYRGETKTALELTDLALDLEVEDEEFRSPEIDPSTEDISESMGRGWEITRFTAMRGLMYRRIRDGVEAGTLEWTSDARARLGKVFRAFHGELAPIVSADTVRWARATVDKFCLWYQEAKRSIPEGDVARADELEDTRIDWEARFRESVDGSIEPYLARAVFDVDEARASKISGEARALELEAAEAACRKSVVEPLLEHFAEQMERARLGELPPAKN